MSSPVPFIRRIFQIDATNETVDIGASTSWISFSDTHLDDEISTVTASLIIPDDAPLQDYSEKITVDGTNIPVSFTVSGKEKGYLQPTFSTLILNRRKGIEDLANIVRQEQIQRKSGDKGRHAHRS